MVCVGGGAWGKVTRLYNAAFGWCVRLVARAFFACDAKETKETKKQQKSTEIDRNQQALLCFLCFLCCLTGLCPLAFGWPG